MKILSAVLLSFSLTSPALASERLADVGIEKRCEKLFVSDENSRAEGLKSNDQKGLLFQDKVLEKLIQSYDDGKKELMISGQDSSQLDNQCALISAINAAQVLRMATSQQPLTNLMEVFQRLDAKAANSPFAKTSEIIRQTLVDLVGAKSVRVRVASLAIQKIDGAKNVRYYNDIRLSQLSGSDGATKILFVNGFTSKGQQDGGHFFIVRSLERQSDGTVVLSASDPSLPGRALNYKVSESPNGGQIGLTPLSQADQIYKSILGDDYFFLLSSVISATPI